MLELVHEAESTQTRAGDQITMSRAGGLIMILRLYIRTFGLLSLAMRCLRCSGAFVVSTSESFHAMPFLSIPTHEMLAYSYTTMIWAPNIMRWIWNLED